VTATTSSVTTPRTATLRLGTRRSALATTQSTWVADRLRALGHEVELVEVVTEGDTSTAPLSTLGGAGVFAAALRRALLDGEVDLAVHSLKDLPTAPHPGLVVAAVPTREDPRDVLVSVGGRTLGELPDGAVVGTGSPRRVAQLAALGLGLSFKDIRGNVDTRVAMVREGALDAVVLARAGLARLGRLDEVAEVIDPLQVLPAPGQGALAVECRADDAATLAAVAVLDDADARACTTAERAVLAALEAGCSAPVGALAEVVEGEDGLELSLRACVAAVDGSFDLRRSVVGPVEDASRLGARLAAVLLEDGADALTPLTPSAEPAPSTPAGSSTPSTRPEQRPPARDRPRPPDPAGATGDHPLAAPDRRPEPDSTERAL
jgi:hydroxymethylbilane synthase